MSIDTVLFLFFFVCLDPIMLLIGIGYALSEPLSSKSRSKLIGILLTIPFTLSVSIMVASALISNFLDEKVSSFLVAFSSPTLTIIIFVLIAILLLLPARSKYKAKGGIPLPALLTVKETAAYLHVSPAAVRQLIQTRQLFATKYGNSYRISRDDLIRFLQ